MHSAAHSDRAAEPMHNTLSDPEAKPPFRFLLWW